MERGSFQFTRQEKKKEWHSGLRKFECKYDTHLSHELRQAGRWTSLVSGSGFDTYEDVLPHPGGRGLFLLAPGGRRYRDRGTRGARRRPTVPANQDGTDGGLSVPLGCPTDTDPAERTPRKAERCGHESSSGGGGGGQCAGPRIAAAA